MNPLDNNSPFNGPLTPHQFRQNQVNTAQIHNEGQTAAKSSSTIRYAPLIIAGLALLVLPLTIWQVNTQQDIRQRAAERREVPVTTNILAKFDGVNITDTDVDLEYTKQQNATAYTVTPTGLKQKILDDVIRKKIIEKEAIVRNITVTEAEIDSKITILNKIDTSLAKNRKMVKDLILEEKVAALVANAKVVNIVFSQNSTPQTESFFEIIRSEAVKQKSLLASAIPYAKQSRDVNIIENTAATSSYFLFTPEAGDSVFELETGELSELIESKDRFLIVEVLSETLGEYADFEDFIQEKKSQQVQIL